MQRLAAARISGHHVNGSTFGDGRMVLQSHPSRWCFLFHQTGAQPNQPSTWYASNPPLRARAIRTLAVGPAKVTAGMALGDRVAKTFPVAYRSYCHPPAQKVAKNRYDALQ